MFSKLTRVSPAMGVAIVALVLSLGGTSFAQDAATRVGKLISGSKIKRASIPGNRLIKGGVTGDRIKANSITGKQINEKTLGTVPSATTGEARHARGSRDERPARDERRQRARARRHRRGGLPQLRERTIPSGTTVTGAFGIGSNVTSAVTVTSPIRTRHAATATATAAMTSDIQQVVQLPGPAPADLSNAT